MAEWLSSCAPLGSAGFCWFGSWAWTWHHSSSHAEVVSHMPQPEGPATRIYNYVLGRFGEKKQKKKKVIASATPSKTSKSFALMLFLLSQGPMPAVKIYLGISLSVET